MIELFSYRKKNVLVNLILSVLLLGIMETFSPTAVFADEEDNYIPTSTGLDIKNRSFENDGISSDTITSWDEEGDSNASFIEELGYKSDFSLKHENDSAYEVSTSQTLTGIENGYYTISAWVKNSGGQNKSYLFSMNNGTSKAMTSLPVTSNWKKVVIRGVNVTNGQITFGIYSDANAGNWVKVDFFEIVKTDKPYQLLKGGDVSEVTQVEMNGGKFYDQNGVEKDVFQTFKENGHDIVRLRLYNDPGKGNGDGKWYRQEGVMDKAAILDLAKRAKNAGLKIQLTFHYSDYWSNGATQIIPNEWQDELEKLSSETEKVNKLESLVYEYTLEIMQSMKEQNTTPEYVSLGNEMQSGILYPYGRAADSTWENLQKFLNAGYHAVKEVSLTSKVILHLDGAGEYSKYRDFFGNAEKLGINYDIIGSSYYPFWTKHTVDEIIPFFNDISEEFNKDIMVMETGYNWSPTLPNGQEGQLVDNGPYPMNTSTPEGQKNFLYELFNGLKSVNNGRVIGVLYWDPVMIDHQNVGWAVNESTDQVGDNVVSNTTLFDFEGKALEANDAFKYNTVGTTGGHISGVIKDIDGRRIPYANVSVTVEGKSYVVKSDRNGNYLFPDLPVGSDYKVAASKQGYSSNTAAIAAHVTAGKFTDVDIILTGAAVAGKVTDQSGNPAKEAIVSTVIDGIEYSTVSNASGEYKLSGLPEGSDYTISASKQGYLKDSKSGITTSIGETTSNVDLKVILNSGTIKGIITDQDGNPVDGVKVSLSSEGETYSATTDVDGKYTIINVPKGKGYTVQANKANYLGGEVSGVEVAVGKVTDNVNISIEINIGAISGTVKDSEGYPVYAAIVTATAGLNRYTVETDELGNYILDDVLAGVNYTITAHKDGYIDAVKTDIDVKAQATIEADLRVATPIDVPNFSFENPNENWIISEGSPTSMSGHTAVAHGELVLSSWAEGPYTSNVYQTITNLKNGYYTVTGLFYNGGGQNEYYMYAKNTGEQEKRVNIPATGKMTPVYLNAKVTNGQMTVGFFADAKSGNWSLVDVIQIGYQGPLQMNDNKPPVTSVELDGNSNKGWYSEDVKVTLTPEDEESIDLTEYSFDNGENWVKYEDPFTISDEGETIVKFRSIDVAGNKEEPKTVSVNIDKSLPTFSLTINDEEVKDRATFLDDSRLYFSLISEDSLSGVESKSILVDGVPYQEGTELEYDGELGTHSIDLTVKDVAGNIIEKTFTFEVTTSIPSIRNLVNRYHKINKIENPLYSQLINKLKQSEHKQQKGELSKAKKHLEEFIDHLNKKPMQDLITDERKHILLTDVNYLIEKLQKDENKVSSNNHSK